jgi:thioredoxin 1
LKIKNKILTLFVLIFVFSACAENPKDQTSTPAVKAEVPAKVKESPKVTFVELGSVNCIPCKMMKPVMEAVEAEYPTQVKVEFIDVWTQKGKIDGAKYKIKVIPTQVFLDSLGKEYFRHEGFFPKDELVKVLKQGGVK